MRKFILDLNKNYTGKSVYNSNNIWPIQRKILLYILIFSSHVVKLFLKVMCNLQERYIKLDGYNAYAKSQQYFRCHCCI